MNRVVRGQNLKLALVADSGLNLGNVFPLSESRQVIGRRIDAGIPIDDTKASREHALVDYRNGFFYLVDLGSTNGTYINGRRVQHAVRLNLGDQLRIGNSIFKVELIKKAQDTASRQWHEPTCVELDAFHKETPRVEDASVKRAQEESSSSLRRVLSSSIPRWFYLVERKKNVQINKRQGVLIMLLICSLLVLSAIFVGFGTSRAL